MPRSSDTDGISTRSSSAVSSRGISEGQSSASGASDATDDGHIVNRSEKRSGLVATDASTKPTSIALEAATAHCSMCDDTISSLLCTQCGRLSFCAACCISLHDNKFLCNHKLISLEPNQEGEIVLLADLKERSKKKQSNTLSDNGARALADSATSQPLHSSPQKQPMSQPAREMHKDPLGNEDLPESIDIASLAADRNIIQARLVELGSCRALLQDCSDGLSKERFRCKDIAQTATEAIRQRFDVVRQVIAAKEADFVSSVERAAKQRLEDATKASFDASASLAECDAFLDQTKLQLDRLSSNKKLFAEARASMMLATESKLRTVDDTIQRLQNEFDRIVSVSLGVHIQLDRVVDQVNLLAVPTHLKPAYHGELHAKPIAVDKFMSSPGVKVVRQHSADPDGSSQSNGTLAQDAAVPQPTVSTHRKSYQQELDALRSTPLKDIKSQQVGGVAPSQEASVPRANFRQNDSDVMKQAPSAISRIAQKYTTAGGGQRPQTTTTPLRIVPKELEALRQVVASTSGTLMRKGSSMGASSMLSARGRSPIAASRADSPSGLAGSRRASPMRSTQLAPYRNSISPSRHNPDATPGPGAYFKATEFTARSFLSTPPRRR